MSEFYNFNNYKTYKLYSVLKPVARIFFTLKYDIKVYGKENIPKDRGFILASNHIKNDDVFLLALNFDRIIHFVAKEELFRNRFLRFFLIHFNAFPIKRERRDKTSLSFATKLLKNNEIVGIFPEGKRSLTGKLLKPKSGISLIVSKTEADVLPVSIKFIPQNFSKSNVIIRIGEALSCKGLGLDRENVTAKDLKSATDVIFNEIIKLWECE